MAYVRLEKRAHLRSNEAPEWDKYPSSRNNKFTQHFQCFRQMARAHVGRDLSLPLHSAGQMNSIEVDRTRVKPV